MGKTVRVLIIFIFLLGIGALVFSYLLYVKRLEFAERFVKFEEALPKLAAIIELEAPAKSLAPNFEERDISDVIDREVPNPQRNIFWGTYDEALEDSPADFFVYGQAEKLQIRKLFYTEPDPAGNPVKVIDPLTNKPRTDGEGTMQRLLDNMIKRSKEQHSTLIETRAQMKRLREEYNKTVEALNNAKKGWRLEKIEVTKLKNEISNLEAEISRHLTTIRRLEQDIKEKDDEIAELNDIIRDWEKKFEDLDRKAQQLAADNVRLQELLKIERDRGRGDIFIGTRDIDDEKWRELLSPGDKGVVMAVDNDLKYVVLKLNESFSRDPNVLGEDLSLSLKGIPLNIRRPGLNSPSGEFVTRVRLRQVSKENHLYIAEIRVDWQQSPVEEGDIVFFN